MYITWQGAQFFCRQEISQFFSKLFAFFRKQMSARNVYLLCGTLEFITTQQSFEIL